MRAWREIRDAAIALAVLGGLIWLAISVERYFGNPDIVVAGGQAIRVVDGDSFRIGGQDMRLYGVDAPEYRQTCQNRAGEEWRCGVKARDALDRMLREPGLVCERRATDRYDRAVAVCRSDDERDIGETLVREGWAVSMRFNDTLAYPFAEGAAERARRGIWRGAFMRPADWRAQRSSRED